MKKIINGKRYDTERAKEIGTWDNGIYGDFQSCSETLYLKRTGEYFLHGCGGAATIYAVADEDRARSGEAIIPLDEAAARTWAEQHLSGEAYEEAFGEVAEAEPRAGRLKELREAAGMTQQQLATAAGLNLRMVQKYESGEYTTANMTLHSALALSAALQVEPKDLL